MEKVVYFLSFSQYALDENAIVVIDHTIKCSSKKLEGFLMEFSTSFSCFCGERWQRINILLHNPHLSQPLLLHDQLIELILMETLKV